MLSLAAVSVLLFTTPALSGDRAPASRVPAQDSFVPARVGEKGAEVHAYIAPSYPVVAELEPGTPVRVVSKRTPWSRIQAPGGFTVWVHENYVEIGGTGLEGRISASHVRARPLPSTAQQSYPVGQFEKGDAVRVLGRDGEWVKVRAPESLGAWVQSEFLVELGSMPGDWESEWLEHRTAALPPIPDPLPVAGETRADPVGDDPSPPVGEQATASGPEPREAATGTEAAVAEPATAAGGAAAVLSGSSLQALVDAELGLARMGVKGWNAAEAGGYESAFRSVIASTDDPAYIARAEQGLERIDAMRTAEQVKLDLQQRQAHYERQAQIADQEARRRAEQPLQTLASPLERYTLIGWVERKPSVYEAVPHVITRGELSAPALSKDGRFNLADYVGREVAVMGSWRAGATPGTRVLEVDSVRVLPRKR